MRTQQGFADTDRVDAAQMAVSYSNGSGYGQQWIALQFEPHMEVRRDRP